MKSWILRLYRLGIVAAVAALCHVQTQRFAARSRPAASLEKVRTLFPVAVALSDRDQDRGGQCVLDAAGECIGYVFTTSPDADRIVGYSGPSNLLVAMNLAGEVAGVVILASEDTPEHVSLVENDRRFLEQFRGWNPAQQSLEGVDAVSGATLTSLAMAEALQFRLRGGAPSLRFPKPISLEELRALFPTGETFDDEGGRVAAMDAAGKLVGFAVRTSPAADNVSGYRGPTECLISLAADGQTVVSVAIRASFDNDSYVRQVKEDPTFLGTFAGRSLQTLASLDFEKEGIEGVSGSTQTSYAVAESLKRRAQAALQATPKPFSRSFSLTWRDAVLGALIVGAVILSFTKLRGVRWLRRAWQILLVAILGILLGDFVSLALLGGWAQHGIRWQVAPGLLALAAAALVLPWATGHQAYCHQLCPHGAAQQLLGKLRRKKLAVPAEWGRVLEKIPFCLLSLALFGVVRGWDLNLAALEAFDAWVFRAGALVSGILAVAGLAASIFVPQAYCRYGCPTGAMLSFLRSAGTGDRFSRKDWAALALLVVSLAISVGKGPG